MSFTFELVADSAAPIRFADLQGSIGLPMDTVEELPADDAVHGLVHVYRPGLTTRAIELNVEGRYVDVRILTCSSPEDYELATALVVAAADALSVDEVQPEGGDVMAVARLRDVYDEDWATEELAFGATAVAGAVDANPGKLVTLQGPIRPFHVGGRLLAELRDGPAEGFAARLIEAMRRTQWPGDCFAASVLSITGGAPDQRIRLAVLSGRTRTLLPDVEAIALQAADGDLTHVRPADVVELLPDHARYLDEAHLLVEPVDPDQWESVLRAAAPRAISLDSL